MADIFLSYSHKDSELMHRVCEDLRQSGFSVWTDAGLEPGTPSWQRAVEDALQGTRCVVVLLSPEAKQSKWVEIEVSLAEEIGLRFFPVLTRGDEQSAVLCPLRTIKRVDIQEEYQKVGAELVPALQRYLQPIESTPQLAQPPKKQSLAIEFDWVTIPAGEFLMGSDRKKDPRSRDQELPQLQVYVPAYRIARIPVTHVQYKQFVEAMGHKPPYYWHNGQIPPGQEDHPVSSIDWFDAQVFCQWAGVRLPTEVEWEKAARGTDGRIYPWGNHAPTVRHANYAPTWQDELIRTVQRATTPVGLYPLGTSPYGVLDMAGNVPEWTSSLYGPYPYRANDGREDPRSCNPRTVRGGSYYDDKHGIRCTVRNYAFPSSGYSVGFRVVFSGF